MKESLNTLSKTQQAFLIWYEKEKANGLKDIKFYLGDVSQATMDSFIDESVAIDRAIENHQHTPIPDTL